jgi:Ion channel
MFDFPTLLAKIPDEYKPLAAIGLGSLVLVGLAMFHGLGLHLVYVQQRRKERRLLQGRPHVFAGVFLFGWSVFLLLSLHMAEILIWATVLKHAGFVMRPYDAIYFCANAYTTLGMGGLDVGNEWRNISPIIGISGLFTFAWTTSALVNVVASNGRLLTQLEDEREREMHMRSSLRKEEWEALKRARAAELAERKKTKMQVSEAPFFQRHQIWEEERSREAELRRMVRAEIAELRRTERQNEEKLGPGEVAAESQDKELGE